MLSGDARPTSRTAPRASPGTQVLAASAGIVVLGLLAGACSATSAAPRRPSTTTSAPTTSTTGAPTTTTTATPTFPAVIVQAMAQFEPLPAGAQAPIRLPAVSGYLTAETGGLGGQDNVTLVTTRSPTPVDSPALSPAGAGSELASFSTTPTTSASTAAGALSQARSQELASCQGTPASASLPGGGAATTCATLEGAAVDWTVGNWAVQVLTLSGSAPSMAEAGHVASQLAADGLPPSDAGGIVSVVVPANASAGSSSTAALEWTVGADVYQVRSGDDPDGALAVAAAMRPYPA